MAHQFTQRRRVTFSETDLAGIMHFSNFFKFMERAEHAFFRSLDLSVWENPERIPPDERVHWPRVHAACDFHAPLRFEEEARVELFVEEVRTRAIRYLIRVWKADGELAGEGRMHNYLRMLWGKKILQWAASPREALAIMIALNNKYALDGRNPNSYSGIFWVLGRYDRPWFPERPVFGVVRYMSSENTARKVRVKGYIRRYLGLGA